MLRLPNLVVSLKNVRSLLVISVRGNSTATAAELLPEEWENAKPFESIPGPKPLPIIGNTWRFIPGIGDFAKLDYSLMCDTFRSQYGKIMRFGGIHGRNDIVMLFDPVDIEKVFRNEGSWPIRTGAESIEYYRKVERKDFFQGAFGLVPSQGEEWGKFRTIVNQPMMQPRVVKNYVGPIGEVAADFVKRIPSLRDQNMEMPKDFLNELYKWALESIAMVALDARLGCLEQTLAPDSEPQKMINSVVISFDAFYELDFKIPFWKLISTPTWRKFVKNADYLFMEIGMKYVNQALERMKSLPPDSDRELSVLERILARDPNPKTAGVMALDMIIAGVDTTANAVGILLYHLAASPDKQRKLQEELDRVLSPPNISGITSEQLNDLKYLKACIKESMRILPLTQGNVRRIDKDMVLQGYRVPKGTDVLMNHRTISKCETHYPDADKLIPERWLKGDLEGGHKTHPFVTLPFGFGARMCVGRRFAELEIEILVAKILQKYNIEWHHGPFVTEHKVINTCKSPLRLKLIDRK